MSAGRTGTLSLKAALDRLGFGPCFHMRNVLDHPERLPLWEAAAAGDGRLGRSFAGYESSVDWPGAAFWRELTAYYSDAKVILTVEIPSAGTTACARRSTSCSGAAPRPAGGRGPAEDPGIATMHAFNRKLVWDGPFLQGRFDDRDWAMRAFVRHNAAVCEEIPPNGCSSSTSAQAGTAVRLPRGGPTGEEFLV